MPKDERRTRIVRMQQVMSEHSIYNWTGLLKQSPSDATTRSDAIERLSRPSPSPTRSGLSPSRACARLAAGARLLKPRQPSIRLSRSAPAWPERSARWEALGGHV